VIGNASSLKEMSCANDSSLEDYGGPGLRWRNLEMSWLYKS